MLEGKLCTLSYLKCIAAEEVVELGNCLIALYC